MRSIAGVVCVAAWLGSALSAQSFVVDAAGAPGSDFTDLGAAIQTVPDGAVLRVRAGSYRGVDVVGKGVSILCDSGVSLRPVGSRFRLVSVRQLPATSSFTLRGLSAPAYSGESGEAVLLDQCQGPVLLDDLSISDSVTFTFTRAVRANLCAQLTLRDSALRGYPALDVSSSSVVVEGCTIFGAHGVFTPAAPATPGISAINGQLVIGRSTVVGGDGAEFAGMLVRPPAPAILGQSAALRIHDDGSGRFQAGATTVSAPMSAIDGSGSLMVDPVVSMVANSGAAPIGAGLATTVTMLPSLRVQDAGLAGTLQIGVFAPVGAAVYVLVALPGAPIPVPFLGGDVWLDPATVALAAARIQPATGTFAFPIPVPAAPSLAGLRVTWQALAALPSQSFQLSNPSTHVLW